MAGRAIILMCCGCGVASLLVEPVLFFSGTWECVCVLTLEVTTVDDQFPEILKVFVPLIVDWRPTRKPLSCI